jgi:hypothetical protein
LLLKYSGVVLKKIKIFAKFLFAPTNMLNLRADNVNFKLQIQTKLNLDVCCNLQHEERLYEKGVLSSAKEVTVIETGIITSRNTSV